MILIMFFVQFFAQRLFSAPLERIYLKLRDLSLFHIFCFRHQCRFIEQLQVYEY